MVVTVTVTLASAITVEKEDKDENVFSVEATADQPNAYTKITNIY